MPLPGSSAFPLSASMVRTEMSQSQAINYQYSNWTGGSWNSGSFAGSDIISNKYTPVNLYSTLSNPKPFTCSSRFDPYLNMSMSKWYGYNTFTPAPVDGTELDLYTHTLYNHCYPSSMLSFNLDITSRPVYITISGVADSYAENVYVYYGKPWLNNGVGSTGSAVLITASGHFYPPYTGDINMTFRYDYVYTASMGSFIYVVIEGKYCESNINL
jgi:hypothetical protein